VKLTPSVASPQLPGAAVTFTAEGQGSSGYQYQFWLFANGVWSVVQPYSSVATWDLPISTPAGQYQVSVWVRTNSANTMEAQNVTSYLIAN
jgi:hypothetical protein